MGCKRRLFYAGLDKIDVPILFVCAREGDSDKLRGFRLGADDYVVKSASPDEVVARVKAVLRRARPDLTGAPTRRAHVLDFGRLVLDVQADEVRIDGEAVPIPAKEFTLLRLLTEHPRQVFTHEQLLEQAWDGWDGYGDTSTVAVHIRRLREKIEPEPTQPRYLVTVWGVGYRFEGVRRRAWNDGAGRYRSTSGWVRRSSLWSPSRC